MPSRRILARLPHVPILTRVARAAGTVIGEAFERHFTKLPPEIRGKITEYRHARPSGTPAVGVDHACELVAGALERRRDVMLDADQVYDEARALQKDRIARRNRRNRRLYDAVVELRREVKSLLGFREGSRYLRFLDGETPREPFYLVRQAQKLTHILETRPPEGALERMPVDGEWSALIAPVKARCEELDETLLEVAKGRCDVIDALAYQRQALADFDKFFGQAARMLETFFDVAGLATLAELVRPRVKRRGRPPKTPIADEYPDLVARALAAGGLEDEARALRSSEEDDSGAQNASFFVSAGEKKIEQPLHECQTGEKKVSQPLHEFPAGEEKVPQPLHECQASEQKIEQPLHESGVIGVSNSKSTVARKSRRRRPVFGVARRDLASQVSRRAPQAGAAMADPAPRLHRVKDRAAHWWRRLRRVA